MIVRYASLLFFAALLPKWASAQTHPWPLVQPLDEHRAFMLSDNPNSDAPVTLFVRDLHGNPVYKVECHNGNYEDSSEINFSGDFQCALFALSRGVRTSWNLLATNEPQEQGSDWLNRGRMTSGQLWGACGADPEYGTIRHFRLRGMAITIEFMKLRWLPPTDNYHRLGGFDVGFSITNDPSALNPTAQTVAKRDAPKSCH